MPPRRAGRSVATALVAVALAGLAGCSGGSTSGATPSATPLAGGATCPGKEQVLSLTGSALAGQGAATVTSVACAGQWAAARFTLTEGGLDGRVALKWSGTAWTPVIVGGATGPCPNTVKSAPAQIRTVLAC